MITLIHDLLQAGLLQGLILSLVAIGVMIPFKLLNLPDLSAEGAYPLGGALAASLIMLNVSPVLATLLAMLAGGVIGLCTAFVHIRFKVNSLLAGIIISTMVYSINLRVMGKPNIGLFDANNLFTNFQNSFTFEFMSLLLIVLGLLLVIYRYLMSEKGLCFRAVGLNPKFAQRQAIGLTPYILLGFFVGNALSAIAGALMVQMQQYADIGMGVGIVIHALAALMIGESLIGSQTLLKQILAPLVGALIYQQIQGLIMTTGVAPSDMKLFTGAIVLAAIGYRQVRV